MRVRKDRAEYFPFGIQIRKKMWKTLEMAPVSREVRARRLPEIMFFRGLGDRLTRSGDRPVQAGQLKLYALLTTVFRHVIDLYTEEQHPGVLDQALASAGFACDSERLYTVLENFVSLFPGTAQLFGDAAEPTIWLADDDPQYGRKKLGAKELLLLALAGENRAVEDFRRLLDDSELAARSDYRLAVEGMERELARALPVKPFGLSLPDLLRAPLKSSPASLYDQLEYIRQNWHAILPPELLLEISSAFTVVHEESRIFAPRGEPGGITVPKFGRGPGDHYPEYERFSPDADWMANVVMLAKMVYVWLDQLSRKYRRHIHRLDQVPDEELDNLSRWGFTGLWLIGLWERSPASQRIKQIAGNPDAISSAYSLYDYVIAHDLGGNEALASLKERCRQRGIRLASDMVPNHTGIYSKWTIEHPDWFVQLDYPPYPSYSFNGPDLSFSSEVSLHIEDGYWDKRDAAVVFKHYDHRDGRTRYIYHGNDGTSTPWNDTAQLNYLIPQVRETVIRTILHVARQFPIIRFDAAMTLAKKHYQRLWYPQPGLGSGVPSRAEHCMSREEFDAAFPEEFWREVVDRVAAEAPDTLLLAEAFWLMEGYFVRTLGMHRVYNSAFMNMLKMEENAKYRQTLKNVLEYDHRILPRFVNFMSNPDEKTAVEQFGKEGKYFGACVLLVTMPGLPMIGHGQIEGFHEKYGMEYRRSYWDEPVDEHMVRMHEEKIFPLMRKRWLFSGSENFVFYDFFAGGHVNEDVFAYSNRKGSERGIILYHNKFAETAGWIRTSTAIAVKDGAGETALVQKTLGSALDFNPDGRYYYGFRDYATGLEYIRSGRELYEKGLFVELEAFEYHAFLDFREIIDDDYGTWGRLCHDLGGRPVASIDEEVKQVRFKGMIDLARQLLSDRPPLLPGEFAVTEKAESPAWEPHAARFTAFLEALAVHVGGWEQVRAIVSAIARELAFLDGLAKEEGDGEVAAARRLALQALSGAGAMQIVAVGWLFFHRLGMLNEKTSWEVRSAEILHEFGLERAVEEVHYAAAGRAAAEPAALAPADAVILLRLMVRWQGFLDLPEMGRLQMLFDDPLVQQFCLVHVSDGCRWFNKERLELLLRGLFLASVLRAYGEVAESGESSVFLPRCYRQTTLLLEQAAEAGYRLDVYLAAGQVRGCE